MTGLQNAAMSPKCRKNAREKKKSCRKQRLVAVCVSCFLPSMMGSSVLPCLLVMYAALTEWPHQIQQWSDGLENNQAGKMLSRSPPLEMRAYRSGLKAGRMRQMSVGVLLFNSVLTETGSGSFFFFFTILRPLYL